MLSGEGSEGGAAGGIVQRGENQVIRQGASSREKGIGGGKVRLGPCMVLSSYCKGVIGREYSLSALSESSS